MNFGVIRRFLGEWSVFISKLTISLKNSEIDEKLHDSWLDGSFDIWDIGLS